ncbi:MAG: UDP-N-acetylmuramoyl-tripeptide--D-alanyl-D-alanine ligase [Helicobacter sp.]|uniref:UDP-N-acetylmuramoyl-tripeptide--D-alanyl-D- alanine ligase n=1 Tax=Helicobacter sp. TaxID=218 RepID=UPI002A908B82|nr:UDP-N-acetylmuramoyl-tripeptide--D-alanyl-D-alanine ligase [Helicobacter sp.]MDY5615521.1 UDP-N-acetylmuramoyl-tripeptide--D-alanyl-D-alanine ligase [Helicobacter sp.]
MQNIDVFMMMSRWVFLIALGYYVIINLQWYHYRLSRVLFKHHKQRWHFFYFLVPVLYFVFIPENVYFYFGFYLYIFVLIIWALRLSKGLVLTGRVLRFFGLYLIFVLFNELLLFGSESSPLMRVVYLLPLIISVFLSSLVEGILLSRYKKIAIETLKSMPNLTIIAVTGSYGKTSLKNFLVQVLQDEFKVYATPRSVNTLTGIIADINQNLSSLTDIYIVEAGARRIGDIKEIVDLINPQIAVIGKIGPAHIEYFKSLDNIYKAKYEILQSPNLQKVYNYKDNTPPQNFYGDITWYPQNISNVDATLEGTSFSLTYNGEKMDFETKILGAFNVANISAAIQVARDFGISSEKIIRQVCRMEGVSHRLSKVIVNDKVILDDSYNGNLDGMLEAIRLSSLYDGRRVIVTPGLVESSKENNIALAEAIDRVFDIVIITGELNSKVLKEHIHRPQKIILKDKINMENILKSATMAGDLILFANDAPSYI